MDIKIIENISETLQVIINCRKKDERTVRLAEYIEKFEADRLQAKLDGRTYFIAYNEVMYFDCADNRTFLYTEDEVYEIKHRLYELEEILPERDFIRTSKSQIININKISSLKPELNRTLLAVMCTGERLYISRKYVKKIRELLEV